MTATLAQPALFSDCGMGFQPVRAGGIAGGTAGGTGLRHVPWLARRRETIDCGPNARGRSKLTIDFQPKINWPSDRVELVVSLLVGYFKAFGAFRKIDDHLMKRWMRILDDYSEDELRWALRAKLKAQQPTELQTAEFKRQFITPPDRFLDKLDYWLSQSPEYEAACAAERCALTATGLAAVRAAERRQWDALTPEQRQQARNHTMKGLRRRCRALNIDPDHVDADPHQIELGLVYAVAHGWVSDRKSEIRRVGLDPPSSMGGATR